MQISVYRSPGFIDENSNVYKIKSVKSMENGNNRAIPDESKTTTLARLYSDGWKIAHITREGPSGDHIFFLEK